MIRRYEETNFVTGLRAYAAFAVVLIHCGGAGLRSFGKFGNELADLGSTGVYVFFTISGFSIAASFGKSSSNFDFIIRRVFRLAPVYYVFLLFSLLLVKLDIMAPTSWAQEFEVTANAYNLWMHFSFLGFFDYRVANSIIGVEWSLNIEMFWYLVLPVLLTLTTKQPKALGVTFGLSLAGFFIHKAFARANFGEASGYVIQWSPFTYGPAFVLGIIAWNLRSQGYRVTKAQSNAWLAIVCAMLILQCFVSIMEIRLLIPLLTFTLLVTGRDKVGACSKLFSNPMALFLGTISYSIYLWHPLVIGFLEKHHLQDSLGKGLAMFFCVAVITVPLSMATYYGVEVPFNRLGRRLGNHRRELTNQTLAIPYNSSIRE